MQNALQLSIAEKEMIAEVSKIFAKYKNKTRQFGIQLIHTHFPIHEDEILYEVHDKNTRTLTTKPIKKSKAKNLFATSWEINGKGEIFVSSLCCDTGPPIGPTR